MTFAFNILTKSGCQREKTTLASRPKKIVNLAGEANKQSSVLLNVRATSSFEFEGKDIFFPLENVTGE